jgi:hypothetical protein
MKIVCSNSIYNALDGGGGGWGDHFSSPISADYVRISFLDSLKFAIII